MGAYRSAVFNNISTGAVADTYKTMAAVLTGDTAGYEIRLRAVIIGVSLDAPADLQVSMKVNRIADISAGGAGTPDSSIAAANLARPRSGSRDGVSTFGYDYSAEPTTYETNPHYQIDFNLRGGHTKEWGIEDGIIGGQDMLVGILMAPRTANAAVISGTVIWEELI